MTLAERALQVWQVLIAAAHNRQTLTYGDVAHLTGMATQGLGRILNLIMTHCRQNRLPPLPVLVVSKTTGEPSDGYGDTAHTGRDREAVFACEWYLLTPRQSEDFEAPE